MKLIGLRLPIVIKKRVLAAGSQRKNTICFAHGSTAVLSAVHNDLSEAKDLCAFEKDWAGFLKKKPQIIAHDLHPEYESTKKVKGVQGTRYKVQAIQHHHAHIAACMAENGLRNQSVVGVAFDGTGLGTDGTLWGGEFLVCDYTGFNRAGHLKEVPLIGGEQAIRQPWRVAAAYGIAIPGVNARDLDVLRQMQEKEINTPRTSSMGRLFDAAGCIVLGKNVSRFEGELAIALEKSASGFSCDCKGYAFSLETKRDGFVIDPALLLEEVAAQVKRGGARESIVYCFHATVARMVLAGCQKIRKARGIRKVALSGGVWQNKLLRRLASDLLYTHGFEPLLHFKLPCNDACVSFGQAVIAGAKG